MKAILSLDQESFQKLKTLFLQEFKYWEEVTSKHVGSGTFEDLSYTTGSGKGFYKLLPESNALYFEGYRRSFLDGTEFFYPVQEGIKFRRDGQYWRPVLVKGTWTLIESQEPKRGIFQSKATPNLDEIEALQYLDGIKEVDTVRIIANRFIADGKPRTLWYVGTESKDIYVPEDCRDFGTLPIREAIRVVEAYHKG